MASSPITAWQIDGETVETVADFIFWGSKITADVDCSHEIKRRLLLGRRVMTNLDSILKSRDITLPAKVLLVKAMVFPIVMLWMWELDHKESWVMKNWCFWIVVLEETLESPLDCKEIQPVHPKENQSWIFTGGTDVEAETPILCPPDVKSWLIGKDPDAGKDWRWKEKGKTEDKMVGWHHWLDGHRSLSKPQELVIDREAWHAIVHGFARSWTWLVTELNWTDLAFCRKVYQSL